MAKGRAGAGWLVAVAVAITVLVSTNVWNPFPDLWDWMSTSGPIADPPARWQERLGGTPQHVTLLEQHLVVEHRDSVEVRSRTTGRRIWQTPADWAAVAGPSGRTVVVAGKLLVKGYQVIDPATGAVLRRDERAAAVWTFSDYLLDVACRTPKNCELTAREPASGDERWHVGLPGMGFVLFADNPELTGSVQLSADRVAERVEPQPMPQLLGFPIDGRVYVVDTAQGVVLPEVSPSRRERIIVLGGRVIHSEAVPRDGGCGVTVIGRDAVTGDEVWRWRDNQLGTITGGGCDQRHQPTGAGDLVLATTPGGRQALLDTGFGRQVLLCAPGERVVAVDGNRAVVRSADGAKFTGYGLDLESGGKPKALWNRKVDTEASAAIRGKVVIVVDRGPDRVIVLDATSGKVRRQVDTEADVLAADANGLLLGQRRDLGYLAFD